MLGWPSFGLDIWTRPFCRAVLHHGRFGGVSLKGIPLLPTNLIFSEPALIEDSLRRCRHGFGFVLFVVVLGLARNQETAKYATSIR